MLLSVSPGSTPRWPDLLTEGRYLLYLLLAAFSLAFGISFTLLLTVILKKNVEKNIREEKEKENKHLNVTVGGNEIPEYPIESEQKVLPYYKN